MSFQTPRDGLNWKCIMPESFIKLDLTMSLSGRISSNQGLGVIEMPIYTYMSEM